MDSKYQDIKIKNDRYLIETRFLAREIQNPLVFIRDGIITIEFVTKDGEYESYKYLCEKGSEIIID